MAVRSPYCPPPPPPATPPAPAARQFTQELPPRLALGGGGGGGFPPPYRPKMPHAPVVPQCSTTAAVGGGPQFLGVRHWGAVAPPLVADFGPPVAALQYPPPPPPPHPALRPQQAYHHPAGAGIGFGGHRTFRRKRAPAVLPSEPPAAQGPALASDAPAAAAAHQSGTPQQSSLPAQPVPRETYDVYRYIEGELEATAQREKEFARYIQSVEAKANSGRRPPAGSLSAMMQSLADKTAHLARCFEAYTRELACADNDAGGEVGCDSDAMVELIVDTPMPSPPDSTDGRPPPPPGKAAGVAAAPAPAPGIAEGVAPAGLSANAAGITGAAAARKPEDLVTTTQRTNNPTTTTTTTTAPPTPAAAAAITLAEDLIKLAVTPAPRIPLGPPTVQAITSTDAAAAAAAAADSRKKAVAPPVDPKRARPDALPFPLPEFSPFWQLAFESASAPARLVEDELYFCTHR